MALPLSELVDIDCEIVHETGAAYLIDFGGKEKVWVPKSIAEWDPDEGLMTMPRKFAQAKGII